jgi:hypothetical protein
MTAIVLTADDGDDHPSRPVKEKAAVPAVTTRKPAPPKTRRIVVTALGAYDPEGDQSENDGDAPLAADGNTVTAWKSERYRRSFTKTGVGLVLDPGRPVTATRVVVATDTPGYSAEVRVGDTPTGPFSPVSRPMSTTPRTVFALRPTRGRYLVLWITSMPASGAAAVNEVAVTARR